MAIRAIACIALLYALAALPACSKVASPAGAPAVAAGNACERKLISPADVAGIFGTPIIGVGGKTLPGDAQSCTFETSSFPSLTITLRPGVGAQTVDTWASGKMPMKTTPLPGVGEQAAWQPELHEVIAQRNNLLCDIQASGSNRDFTDQPEVLQQKLGALCNKIFAAY
ncbi:MAG TPA: hypothetical protein VGH84_12085 [Steroidobacteraceae bacterium]|jgi:hypothetical protein